MRIALAIAVLSGCATESRTDAELNFGYFVANRKVDYGFPLPQRELFYQTVGVDHDPEVHEPGIEMGICTNYDGRAFPWCYDEHDGTDFLLEGGFETMDAGSAEIVAAANGVVVDTEDGNYDRCHLGGDLVVTCDGHEQRSNYVILEHADGNQSMYWHMMNGSVAVEVGQQVSCGETLGLVGSSGNSSMPHLHFEIQTPDGAILDPYAGEYSQEESYWIDQGPAVGLPGPGCTTP